MYGLQLHICVIIYRLFLVTVTQVLSITSTIFGQHTLGCSLFGDYFVSQPAMTQQGRTTNQSMANFVHTEDGIKSSILTVPWAS